MKFFAFVLLLLVASAYCCQPIAQTPKAAAPNEDDGGKEENGGEQGKEKSPEELTKDVEKAKKEQQTADAALTEAKRDPDVMNLETLKMEKTKRETYLEDAKDWQMKEEKISKWKDDPANAGNTLPPQLQTDADAAKGKMEPADQTKTPDAVVAAVDKDIKMKQETITKAQEKLDKAVMAKTMADDKVKKLEKQLEEANKKKA
ncbi:hypothetical protein L596_008716 [Steinernema carpocapsae]|uniref:SXP/RAL-2 family protein Ani s 5-like cation-binding domain-containing protein n=1 Tax=Steinernema carpocapsae TaxID=34508 RepID=A0A4U5PDC1_STECR|nr:hypothetical protein L596_008715 [Steinernema carpocapsae]TKR94437.1 hypothetical protein L596_008716 [Steinernema carpocapsae]